MIFIKELLEKLSKYIKASIEIGRRQQYIVYYNGLPVLINIDELKSGINRAYVATQNSRYLDIPVELKSIEMLRAEAKLKSATQTKENE